MGGCSVLICFLFYLRSLISRHEAPNCNAVVIIEITHTSSRLPRLGDATRKLLQSSLNFFAWKLTQDEITCIRISETWRKHATPCFRYVYVKVVWFRCIRSNGNARKRHETCDGNTRYPSCFRNGLTCFCHVSVYGFLQFRPV